MLQLILIWECCILNLKIIKKGEIFYLKSISLEFNNAVSHSNYGNLLNLQGRYIESINEHNISIKLKPNNHSFIFNLSVVYKNLGYYHKSIELLKKSIKINNNFPDSHFTLSNILLQIGDYKNGWKEYEWRFHKSEMVSLKNEYFNIYSKKRWDGENLNNKSILIHSEQGYGDSIQMVRYIHFLKEKYNCYIILSVRKGLENIFKNMKVANKVIIRNNKEIKADFHLPIMSLPYYFDINLKKVSKKYPYLNTKKIIKIPNINNNKIKIGIRWGGSNTGGNYNENKLLLSKFKEIINNNKIQIISLQIGEDLEQINEFKEKIIDTSNLIKDFEDTASIIKQCDLVITNDTSVAHLSGAIGKETWIMIKKIPDWRWGVDSNKSIWYPSVKLFRQYSFNYWDDVYDRVLNEIKMKFKL